METLTRSTTITAVKDFSVAVKDARLSRKLSQQELSEQTRIPRPWISQLEQGRIRNPGLDRCLALCKALGISMGAEYSAPVPEQLAGRRFDALTHGSGAAHQVGWESGGGTGRQQGVLAESAFEASLRALKERSDVIEKDAEGLNGEPAEPSVRGRRYE